jgi:NAD(P)-dependent dehydrogenase (short-subunit alcohol dehydrogenase family)
MRFLFWFAGLPVIRERMTVPHALITGAAKRVGRTIALSLAEAGYAVTIHYRHSQAQARALQDEIQARDGKAALVQGDLNNPDYLPMIMDQACAGFGAVSLLVHNASLFERDQLANVTPAMLHHHMQVNLFAPVLLTQALLPHLADEQQAQVICLSDGMRGWRLSSQFLSYSLSKLALEQWVQLNAQSLAPQIRINAIAPGATIQGHMDYESTFERTRAVTPLQRNSSPEEVAEAILSLERLPSVTGQTIYLSGGVHLFTTTQQETVVRCGGATTIIIYRVVTKIMSIIKWLNGQWQGWRRGKKDVVTTA